MSNGKRVTSVKCHPDDAHVRDVATVYGLFSGDDEQRLKERKR